MNVKPPLRTLFIAAVVFCGLGGAALAQAPQRLDSAASPRQRVAALQVTDENGQPLALNPFAQQANARFGRVEYRLGTGGFLQRRARIDIVLPPEVNGLRRPSGLLFRWRGLDGALDGQLRPGQRQPVWSGTITDPLTSLAIDLELQLDLDAMGQWNGGAFGVEPSFELVTLP